MPGRDSFLFNRILFILHVVGFSLSFCLIQWVPPSPFAQLLSSHFRRQLHHSRALSTQWWDRGSFAPTRATSFAALRTRSAAVRPAAAKSPGRVRGCTGQCANRSIGDKLTGPHCRPNPDDIAMDFPSCCLHMPDVAYSACSPLKSLYEGSTNSRFPESRTSRIWKF